MAQNLGDPAPKASRRCSVRGAKHRRGHALGSSRTWVTWQFGSQGDEFSLVSMESHGWTTRRGPRHRHYGGLFGLGLSWVTHLYMTLALSMLGKSMHHIDCNRAIELFDGDSLGLRTRQGPGSRDAKRGSVCRRPFGEDDTSTQAGIPGSIYSVAVTNESFGLGIPNA